MPITVIPAPTGESDASAFLNAYLKALHDARDRGDERAANLLKFTGDMAASDPAIVDAKLRAIQADPVASSAFKRLTGADISKVGTTTTTVDTSKPTVPLAPAQALGVPAAVAQIPQTVTRRAIVADRAPTVEEQTREAQLRGAKAEATLKEAEVGRIPLADESAKLDVVYRKALTDKAQLDLGASRFEGMKVMDSFRYTDANNRLLKFTPAQRTAFMDATQKGASFDDAWKAAGVDASRVILPTELQNRIMDLADTFKSIGYDDETSVDYARDIAVLNPYLHQNLENDELQARIELLKAQRMAVNAKEPPNPQMLAENRLRSDALAKAHAAAYGLFFGADLRGFKINPDGTVETKGTPFAKITGAKLAGGRGSRQATGIEHGAIAAMIDPTAPIALSWMAKHKITPPATPDDVNNLELVMRAIESDYGAELAGMTLMKPDPTPLNPNARTAIKINTRNDFVNAIAPLRAEVMRAREALRLIDPVGAGSTIIEEDATARESDVTGGTNEAAPGAAGGSSGAPNPPRQASPPAAPGQAAPTPTPTPAPSNRKVTPALTPLPEEAKGAAGATAPSRLDSLIEERLTAIGAAQAEAAKRAAAKRREKFANR